MAIDHATHVTDAGDIDGPRAWARLTAAMLLGTIGCAAMWSVAVSLPAVQTEFGVARGEASLPYTLTMLGFGIGGVVMGRIADRFGVIVPIVIGASAMSLGYILAGYAQSLWQFAIVHGLLIGGLGASALFGPLLADISHWFRRRRGIAVSLVSCGSYFAGVVWPPILQYFIQSHGWRATHIGFGIVCALTMLPLTLAFRRHAPADPGGIATAAPAVQPRPIGVSGPTLQWLLAAAGVACCVAMSMPQVHIVAYCGDLGYGPARGAEMLSVMLGFGIVSRLVSGVVADRIGGLMTLLISSILQGIALLFYIPFDGLISLYIISALFGLFQGGIIPMYAIIVREYFPPREAGSRVGLVLMATLIGMSFGGWMTGAMFDLTGSYRIAFLNGIAWNLVNVAIVAGLIWSARRPTRAMA